MGVLDSPPHESVIAINPVIILEVPVQVFATAILDNANRLQVGFQNRDDLFTLSRETGSDGYLKLKDVCIVASSVERAGQVSG